MSQTTTEQPPTPGKGKAFFDRADQVANTGNWDFAIELYIEGLRREPENMDRGHKKLREMAMRRTSSGGKPAGMMEKLKKRPGKDPLESLLNAEFLLAKEPGSEAALEQALKAAETLKLTALAKWFCDIMMESQRQAAKKNRRLLLILADAYTRMTEYAAAVAAVQIAQDAAPGDSELGDLLQQLQTKYTIKKGNWDVDKGDFTKSVKDLKGQQDLIQKDSLSKGDDYLLQQINRARKEYEDSPMVVGKVNGYVDALLEPEHEDLENQAIEVLTKAHKEIRAYQFKMRIGDIRIRQLSRKRRAAAEAGDAAAEAQAAKDLLTFELKEWAERAQNYPTDLSVKFELGRRQLAAGDLDGAIGSLQDARRDPRRTILATTLLGQAFAAKGWLKEAADTFNKALSGEVGEDRAKELRYCLGDVLEKMNDLAGAQEQFSSVALLDYNFKDVRHRLEAVRKKLA